MYSLWEQSVKCPDFNCLDQDIETDVLIIGGGLCGVLCAYLLHAANINYTLVEAETICSGISKNTTAKITSQHGLIYSKLLQKVGLERTRQYLDANEAALQQYRKLCKHMDCDFENKDAYVYSVDDPKKIEKELSALKTLGYPAEFTSTLPLPFSIVGAVKFPHQAQFHPLKFVSEISQRLNIYEHTQVQKVIGTKAITNHGTIQAKKIIVTTHFPFLNRHGCYFMKLYQQRSYVIALENAIQVDGMYLDEASDGMSFRNYKNLLLIGGGDHRTGKKGGSWQQLREFAKQYYPHAIERYHWATQDCMTLDGIPYIGQYSTHTDDWYVATGFNKWGMTSCMVAAVLLTDLVQGKTNPYSQLFDPSRSILQPQLAVNILETTISFLTPTTKRCPHLGCALKWNPYEHTWDCPCHGSRFTKDGKLLDNPATRNKKS